MTMMMDMMMWMVVVEMMVENDDVDGGGDPHGDGRKCESLNPELFRNSLCLQ